jgi:hypothetical protein
MNEFPSFECENCGHTVQHNGPNAIAPCPQCDGERWKITMKFEDKIILYDELVATMTNKEGNIVAERIQKTDLNTSANLTTDAGQPSKVAVDRKGRVDGFEEEGVAAEALAKCYNKARGTNYIVQKKAEEDSDYADRVFLSESDNPRRINIQIRHLDAEIIAKIGRVGEFDGDRTPVDVIASIRHAIEDKANVDPAVKAQTILQLIVLAALGAGIRLAINSDTFDHKGFKEIWITPFHEDSFPLCST